MPIISYTKIVLNDHNINLSFVKHLATRGDYFVEKKYGNYLYLYMYSHYSGRRVKMCTIFLALAWLIRISAYSNANELTSVAIAIDMTLCFTNWHKMLQRDKNSWHVSLSLCRSRLQPGWSGSNDIYYNLLLHCVNHSHHSSSP